MDDVAIAEGVNAPSYQPALDFTVTALADAEAAGFSVQDIYLTGHSLGAAEAEYVATQTGLSGTTFGTPGIPTEDIPATTTAQFTDYVERGNPVGNYAVGFNDTALLQTQNVQHFGTADSLGSLSSEVPLLTANVTYLAAINASNKVEELAGIATTVALLDKAAVEYHALLTYAADLGVTVSGAAGAADGADGGAGLAAALFGKIPGVTVDANGSLDLAGSDLTAAGAVSASGGGMLLTLDGQTATLAPLQAGSGVSLQSDGAGGTLITLGTASNGFVLGGSDDTTIQGNAAPLTFIGGSGSVSIIGGGGGVTLYGATSTTASTFLEGGSGTSILYGGAGATTLVAGTGTSTLVGGSGPTLMLANGSASAELVAGSGATTINGLYGSGPSAVFAGKGADAIAIGPGADTVIGGSGRASITGGSGPDVYGFINGHAGGSDVISGLKAHDIIAFGGYGNVPITSETVTGGSDLMTLADHTSILWVGINHKIFS